MHESNGKAKCRPMMDADGSRLGHPFVVGLEAHGDGRIIVSRKRLGDK